MSENVANEQLEKKVETPESDPIADRSFSVPIVVCALLMTGTLLWALYDEILGQRPWKTYQRDFVDTYSMRLERMKRTQSDEGRKLKETPEYQQLEQTYKDAVDAVKDQVKAIDDKTRLINQKLSDINDPFQNVRAWIAAKTYAIEIASEDGKADIREEIEEKKKEKIEVAIHNDQGVVEDKEDSFNELQAMYNSLTDEKAQLATERIEITKEQVAAKTKLDDFTRDNHVGLTTQQLDGILNKMEGFNYTIKQINLQGTNVVDRCESCHLGIREPVTLTRNQMGGEAAFVSHPKKELLQIHDPERFGCSTCHGGNGRGTTSVTKGHGRYKHWLWPLYYKENIQAGCNQCHNQDRVTPMANVLNKGKNLFQIKGCTGCHRYEGFDRESEAIAGSFQTIKQLEMEKSQKNRDIRDSRTQADNAASDEQARELLSHVDALKQQISILDAKIDEQNIHAKYLLKDQKKVGPNLKEIKVKLRKEWLPVWLRDPQAFRPGTKMPSFRLDDDEVKAISAFLWQSSLDPEKDGVRIAPQAQGDVAHGQELFKSIGCLACHSVDGNAINMGEQVVGGQFAANLTRVGEKASFDYIVRWIHNPRERLAPYSPSLKRDLLPKDYLDKGVPFLFNDEYSTSPMDGHQMQVQNMTVMPNFRLSDQDARDIASFLWSLKKAEPSYPDAGFLDDTSLFERGKRLTQSYGCAGCHEVRGFESEQRIGTELTLEGSKPIERLDFALLTEDAKLGVDPVTNADTEHSWYNHKGFFENKLRHPGIYDRGKVKTPEERLKMPNIYLTDDEITALTTFLLGSVTSGLPDKLRFMPTGQQKHVQDGWWIVQKYNCMGCHNVLIGEDSTLMGLPMYQDADGKEQLPPRLTSQGARVQPDWLMKFLKDPSLGGAERAMAAHLSGTSPPKPAARAQTPAVGTTPAASPPPAVTPPAAASSGVVFTLQPQPGLNRNGVRQYLRARMPTFNFSPNELQAVVNFFMGASSQPQPYIPERLDPLTTNEQTLARALFTSQAAPCLKCHMTGEPSHDARATAPNFLLAPERLKPGWTERWLVDPSMISPGTSMPSGLFARDAAHNRWVFNGPVPSVAESYNKDHAKLLVRYMFQMTPEEQRRLLAAGGASSAPASAPAAGSTTTSSVGNQSPRKPVARAGSKAARPNGP